jgi:hypothetical protein
MTVGRDSSRFIKTANMPFFSVIHGSERPGVRPQVAAG